MLMDCEKVASFFALFANPTRVKLFCSLKDGPQSVGALAEMVSASMPNVSQHLRLMRSVGAVETTKDGHTVYYSITDARFLQAAKLVQEAMQEQQRKAAGL